MGAHYTSFGKKVKRRLLTIGQTETWLAQQASERTGLFVDLNYLSKILTGRRHPDKVINAIKEILEIA